VNPQQVFPGTKVAIESEALGDLIAGDNLALDSLVALAWALGNASVLPASLVKVRGELVRLGVSRVRKIHWRRNQVRRR
jgi:hypothetical protein